MWVQNKQAQFANQNYKPYPEYRIGDKVYVNARHFVLEKSKNCLILRMQGPGKSAELSTTKHIN